MKYVSCVLLAMIILTLSNCSKDDPKLPALITSVFPATGQPGTSVSIHGSHFGQTPGDNVVTFNGVEAEVTQASDTLLVVSAPENASGGPIAVTVNKQLTNGPEFRYYHIYCYGSQNYYPAFWIDGVATVQAEQGDMYDLAVSGNDVYGVGMVQNANYDILPKLWKNNQEVEIPGVPPEIRLSVVAVSGNDVYVGGSEYSSNPRKTKYWKNGALVFTSDPAKVSTVSDMVADGSDVYLSGDQYPVAAYWKNGNYMALSDETTVTKTAQLRIIEGDVHIVGASGYASYSGTLKYWKNGVSMLDDNLEGFATGFALHGDDLFICGYTYGAGGQLPYKRLATYWKNGEPVLLSDNTQNRYISNIEVTDDAVIVLVNSPGSIYKPSYSTLLLNGEDITPDYGPGLSGEIQGMFIQYY